MDRNSRKVRQGIVSSSAMDKTITVVVENRKRHPMYNKVVMTTKKLKAHDEKNEAGEGDLVEIMETRPLSATKRWRLVRIVEKKK
ncbi:MAG: 30S ribosomal protein S17 [Fibrobacteraceae bacterium]|jgi:small subunit ribosomal protein S17